MTEEQFAVLQQLRDAGYAVITWTPEELAGAEASKVEERSVEFGWEIIDMLVGD